MGWSRYHAVGPGIDGPRQACEVRVRRDKYPVAWSEWRRFRRGARPQRQVSGFCQPQTWLDSQLRHGSAILLKDAGPVAHSTKCGDAAWKGQEFVDIPYCMYRVICRYAACNGGIGLVSTGSGVRVNPSGHNGHPGLVPLYMTNRMSVS